jgi:hypothetical protein
VFSITQPGAVSAPTVQSLQPQSTPQCATSCAAVPVAIHGSGFGPGSGVLLDTTEYAPTYVSSSELDLAIPGALLSPARTVQVRVRTGTQVSDPVPFFITETAAAVQSSDTATSTSSSGTASASTGGVDVTATGAGTVTVAQYSADPVSVSPPAGTSNFFDVNIAAGSFTSVQVIDCALDPANTSHLIYWYDGTQWLPVSNQTYVAPCVTMVFTNVSAPAIADLVGTPLAEGNGSVRSAVVGPENTEGILRVSAGDWLSAGYRLKLTTKSKKTVSVSLTNARLVVPVTCGDGRSATLEVALQGRTYTLPAGSTSWTPTADADSPSGYQGAIRVVDACSGTGMRTTSRGASLVASVTTSPDRVQVSLSFHYRDPKAKGKHDISCADVSTNREPGVSDCTATWSAATTV